MQLGSWSGLHLSPHVPIKSLKLLLATVLAIVAVLMFVRGMR